MPGGKFALDLNLPITLERTAQKPLHQQLREQLRQAILDGRLAAGTLLPSTRGLARALGVSRTVTSSAYDELFAEGYLEGRHGSGTYVGKNLPPLPPPPRQFPEAIPRWLSKAAPSMQDDASIPAQAIAFRLGVPSLSSLPLRIWHEVWRSVANQLPPNSYGPENGDPELRTALANYLGRSRGLACSAEDIIITAGATHALDLIVRATLSAGDYVGFEEPGYPSARQIVLARQGRILPIPVDDDGMQVGCLPQGPAAPLLVYTTPSHQYPLGTRLSTGRRLSLLNWAQASDSLLIEDDYDSEFRFDTSPLPALASLDEMGRVAYIGTFSKVLTPALRLGYLVAPPLLRERIEVLKQLTDEQVSWPLQRMLASFICQGHLDRHIRRMRYQYAEKRQCVAQTLAPIAHLARLRGLEAGLHVYLELEAGINAALVAQLARKHNVIVTLLDAYYLGTPDRSGLLLGYGCLEIPEIIRGVTILREIITQVAARSQQI
ncbi:PLP-dependent aminotransferase family protein [Ktedonosporobacter rubrisoli]|nr:PLP-dependent aminotransferase family protein [Ktedonosporobacter rubrisoli]